MHGALVELHEVLHETLNVISFELVSELELLSNCAKNYDLD
jgi:hypothetical protein